MKKRKRSLHSPWTWLNCVLFLFSSALPARADTHVTVAADGSGNYTKLQDAINAVPASNNAPYIIDIKPGTYSMPTIADQFMVDSPKVTLNGLGTGPSSVVITGKYYAGASPNDRYQHATVVVLGNDFTAKNVTFANTLGDGQGQGLAIYANADRLSFLNCRFLGWQDTLRAEYGRQYFENCYVEGDVDFIYGHATGYFKNCSLYVKSDGYVTAPDTRTSGDYRSKGLVLSGCTITGATNNAGYLGRPWNPGGLSVYLNCKIGPVIKAVGWGGTAGQATFAEYRSTDLNGTLLNVSGRASWSTQLSSTQAAAYSQSNWLSGPDNWVPPSATATVPAAPTGLSATAGNAQVSLTWSASSGATSYNVKRAMTSGGPYTTVSPPTGTSYTNTGLTNGTTYYYVVSAVNSAGQGGNSSQVSATPRAPAPPVPANLTSTADNGQASLSWSASSGATGYNVKRATTAGGPYTTIASATATNYVNTGLTNGTTYYYVVSAVNAGSESVNSTQTGVTPSTASSATLQVETGTIGGGITIDSDNIGFNGTGFLNFPATGGFVQLNNVNGGTGGAATVLVRYALGVTTARTGLLLVNGVSQPVTFAPTGGWTTWLTISVNITLNSGTTNTIRLESNGTDLGNIDEITVTPSTGPTVPAAPTGLAVTASSAQVSLSWSSSSGATSYNVKRATTSGGPYTTVSSPTGTSYVNTGLTNGTTYYYVVSTVNGTGESANSSQTSATPAVPTLSGLLMYEGFAYTSGATIANQTGGFGWGANWSSTGNPQDVSATQAASLVSGTLLGSGVAVKFGPSSAGGSTSAGVYMRQFASNVGSMAAGSSGTVWLSLLYLNSTVSVDSSGYYGEARIGLYSGVTATGGVTQTAGAINVLNTGTPATSATVFDRISLYLGSTINATTVATPRSTTPAFLLLKIVADNTTATDAVYLWVNPNLANGEPAIATANTSWTTSDLSAVNGLRFQQAGTNGGVVTNIDEIRLGRTFADVSPSSTLPSPWASADIGSVSAAGSAGHSSGVFTVAGSGAGIAGTADEFRSVHQSASGDCSIVARVTAMQNTSANAKAGVSIRETTADTSAQATCAVANGSVSFIYRSTTGGASTTVPVSGVNPPGWVRVDRVGDTFTAAYSSDGITWTRVGTATILMATNVTLGTVVTSQADGTLTTATVDNVTATP